MPMNRSRSFFLTASLLLLLPIATGVLWSAVSTDAEDDGDDSLYKYLSIFSEVFGLVRNNYVDATAPDELLSGALEGVGDALDPFSALVPEGQLAEYERGQTLSQKRSGLLLVKDHGIAYVLSVGERSPAATAGIEQGDVLAELGGADTRDQPTWRLQRLLAGEPGEKIEARIVRQGQPSLKTLELGDYASLPPRLEESRGVPILRLARIEPGDAQLVRSLLQSLAEKRAPKLLLDLQGIGGGAADEAFAIAGLFAAGELGRLEGQGGDVREFRSETPAVWSGELAVAVDGGTFGAAEILAAALEKRAGAKLVGLKTFGWAGEREFVELTGGARLHLTTAFYQGPDGTPIAGGLAPGVLVDDLPRGFGDNDIPLDQRIRERALDVLLGLDESTAKAA
ncbi:MAG: S41 family peptidase [Myxococcota bacterium]